MIITFSLGSLCSLLTVTGERKNKYAAILPIVKAAPPASRAIFFVSIFSFLICLSLEGNIFFRNSWGKNDSKAILNQEHFSLFIFF